jgi:hypothetical protein
LGADGCLHNYVTAGGQVLSDTASNLCRSAITLDGQTYYLAFQQGKTSASWVEEYGTIGDGYVYWRYPNSPWLRQANAGGPEQIKVQYADGSTGYQNLDQWEAGSSQGSTENITLRLDELGVSQLIRQIYTLPVNSTQLTQDQLQQAQQQLQQKDQQIRALQQQARDNAPQNGNSQALTYEDRFLTQMNGLEDRVWTQPDCNYTGYCAP